MTARALDTGTAVVAVVAAGIVVVGGYAVATGIRPMGFGVTLALLVVSLLGSYRALVVQTGLRDPNALTNVVLFAVGSGAYGAGVHVDVAPVEVAGEVLFAFALAFFAYRLDQL